MLYPRSVVWMLYLSYEVCGMDVIPQLWGLRYGCYTSAMRSVVWMLYLKSVVWLSYFRPVVWMLYLRSVVWTLYLRSLVWTLYLRSAVWMLYYRYKVWRLLIPQNFPMWTFTVIDHFQSIVTDRNILFNSYTCWAYTQILKVLYLQFDVANASIWRRLQLSLKNFI